jgi:hypothetical protein
MVMQGLRHRIDAASRRSETAQSHSSETAASHPCETAAAWLRAVYEWGGLPHHVRDVANLLICAAICRAYIERLLLIGLDGVEVNLDLLLAEQAT